MGEMEPLELAGASLDFGLGAKEPFLSGILKVGTRALGIGLFAAPRLTRVYLTGLVPSNDVRLLVPMNFGAGDKSRFCW